MFKIVQFGYPMLFTLSSERSSKLSLILKHAPPFRPEGPPLSNYIIKTANWFTHVMVAMQQRLGIAKTATCDSGKGQGRFKSLKMFDSPNCRMPYAKKRDIWVIKPQEMLFILSVLRSYQQFFS